jgi:hypothetical protein
MMQPTKDWNRCDTTDLLRPPKVRSIFIQRTMRPNLVLIRGVVLQNVAQVRFAEHYKVVE